jgi:transposase
LKTALSKELIMAKKNRRKFDAAFKARVAMEAVRETETIAQIAQRHGVHPINVSKWKKQLLDGAQTAFENGAPEPSGSAQREDELLKKIGELTIERDFLARGLRGLR